MFDQKGRVWLAAAGREPKNPDFCKKGSDHPSAVEFPLNSTHRRVTIYDPKTGKYTAFDTCFGTHHLQFGYDANDTLWSPAAAAAAWSAGSTPRCSTRPATSRRRRAGPRSSSTPTATASATNTPSPASRWTRPRTCASARPSMQSCRARSTARSGAPSRQPGAIVRIDPAKNPPHGAVGNLQRPDARLRPARRRHRQARRGLGVARQRPHRQLRSPQMQGPAQRTEGDRRSLPGGLGVLQVSGPGLRRHRR